MNVLKRSFTVLAIIIAMFSVIASPLESYATASTVNEVSDANDPNSVQVTIDANGKLQISGGGFGNGKVSSADAWSKFIAKYQNFITGLAGIGAVTMIVLFIFQFLKLGASAGNPQARSQALAGCLWTGIAAMGLGAVTIIVGFFYNAIR